MLGDIHTYLELYECQNISQPLNQSLCLDCTLRSLQQMQLRNNDPKILTLIPKFS